MPAEYPDGTELVYNEEEIEWTPESGDSPVFTYSGARGEIYDKFLESKNEKLVGGIYANLASMTFRSVNGRATLVQRGIRENRDIEELYAVDVVKDLRTCEYYDALSDAQIAAVSEKFKDPGTPYVEPTGWNALQKKLFFFMSHGEESYLETQFILRLTKHAVLDTEIGASFDNINKVVAAPEVSESMANLIASLPAGEWMKKPPQTGNQGFGRWRVEQEWHWAKRWAVHYNGTWGEGVGS